MSERTIESIELTINGKPVTLPHAMSVLDYLHTRNHHERLVVVELNGEILPKAAFATRMLATGDKIEIVHFVGGG